MTKAGIVSYGYAVPKRRLKVDDVIKVWQNTPLELVKFGFKVRERAVLGVDEDVITLSIEAAKNALNKWNGSSSELNALYLGTCTNPYDSRSSAAVILEALGLANETMCADVQFSGKSGTAAMQICQALVASGLSKTAMAIGADTINRHIAPGDMSEAYAGAGAGVVVVGNTDVIAEIEATTSYVSDLPDGFRLEGERYIRAGMMPGSTKNEIGIDEHTVKAAKSLFNKMKYEPKDFQYAVFQQPFVSTAYSLGRKLGFSQEQVTPGIYANVIGDAGSASTLLGLGKVLDTAKPGERILVVSYGFGAGSDAIILKVTDNIEKVQRNTNTLQDILDDKIYVDYPTAMFPSASLVGNTEIFDALNSKTIDIGILPSSYVSNKMKEMGVFEIPGMWKDKVTECF